MHVTRWWVFSVALLALLGYSVTPPASAVTPLPAISEIIVRYELGAPALNINGRLWGSQCVRAKDRSLLKPGRWIGAGMRRVALTKVITQRRANQITTALATCPYVMWAEPNAVVLDLQLDPPARA
jgi:hypothetical protein